MWFRRGNRTARRLGYLATLSASLAESCEPLPPPSDGPIDDIVVDDQDLSFSLQPGPLKPSDIVALEGLACVAWSVDAQPHASHLQLVVDVSGSMSLPADNEQESKWSVTSRALKDAVQTLPPMLELGALFFPNQSTQRNCQNEEGPCVLGDELSASACVKVEDILKIDQLGSASSLQRAMFNNALLDINPAGGTPTHDAYELAQRQLEATVSPGESFILLITDGQPTFLKGCAGSGRMLEPVDERPIIDAIIRAREDNVRTFVIGSPGSERNAGTDKDVRPWLSSAALEGGTAKSNCSEAGPDYCHFDMSVEEDFSVALLRTLNQVLGQVRACELALPEVPESASLDHDAVNVILMPEAGSPRILARSEEPECQYGWRFAADHESIHLCSNACERFRQDARTKIELLFGCQSVGHETIQ